MHQQKTPTAAPGSLTKRAPFSSPVLTALRAATKSRHGIVDVSMPLSKPDATWPDYVEHLRLLAGWLYPIEQWLSNFNDGPQGEQAPPFFCYTDAIFTDIAETYKPTNNLWQNEPPWASTIEPAYRWGVCYVIEGSQLGGEFLYQRLAERLAPHELKYLQCKQAGRWPQFLQAIAVDVTTQGQINSACEGAMDAFDALLLQLHARENIL